MGESESHGCQPRRKGATALLLLLSLLVAISLHGCSAPVGADQEIEAQLAGEAFTLKLALTQGERFRGLSGVEHIPADWGMLFVFPESRELAFVMRDCLVPIDVIFIDAGGRIVSMYEMKVEPANTPEHRLRRYRSVYPAMFVIELAGGRVRELGLKRGQKLDLPWERLKPLAE